MKTVAEELQRLKAEVVREWRRAENAEAEVRQLKTAIDNILGNGADEEMWPPGTDRTVALTQYVERNRARILQLECEVDDWWSMVPADDEVYCLCCAPLRARVAQLEEDLRVKKSGDKEKI